MMCLLRAWPYRRAKTPLKRIAILSAGVFLVCLILTSIDIQFDTSTEFSSLHSYYTERRYHLVLKAFKLVLSVKIPYVKSKTMIVQHNCPASSPVLEKPVYSLTETHQFQSVDSGDLTYVYSAYLETRMSDSEFSILMLGITRNYKSVRGGSYGFCVLWFKHLQHPIYSKSRFSFVPETHEKKYAASYHSCAFNHKMLGIPYAASLVFDKCVQPLNILKIMHIDKVTAAQNRKENGVHEIELNKVNFTVCVAPITQEFNDFEHFVEMIECNRIFGAQRFVFYDYLVGDEVQKVIQSLSRDGIAKLLPWKLPIIGNITKESVPDIHYYGQVAAINDCLFRNILSSRFIVFTDLDELIVPRRHHTWLKLLNAVTSRTKKMSTTKHAIDFEINYAAVYSVRNAFFRNYWGSDPNIPQVETVKRMNLQTLLTTYREAKIFPHGIRSKYIVNPFLVRQVGIHFVYEFTPRGRQSQVQLPPKYALLHHYRQGLEPSKSLSQRDTYMHKFTSKIIASVRDRRSKLELSNKSQSIT